MRKIISILVVAMMLATCIFATVPASAATKTFEVDWTALAYVAYNENGSEVDEFDFLNSFEVTKEKNTFGVSRIGSGVQSNSYVSTSQFAITADTSYTYEVMAKNNNTAKYSGVPFAIDSEGMVYFIYGSFDNNNDSQASQKGKSYVIGALGKFDNKYPNSTGDEFDSMYFQKLQLTSGFASFKFEYEGLKVKVYAKEYTNGNYVQMGEEIPLPEGSKLVFGVFSRDDTNGGNRTTTVKNAKITGNNDAAVKNMVLESNNGAGDLKAEILRVEKEYPEVNYTADSYSVVKDALESAKAIAEDSFSTADDVSAAMAELASALEGLELAELDTSKLEKAIKDAEKLNKADYTLLSYKMVSDYIAVAKELLTSDDATQFDINAALETLNGRISSLVSVNGGASSDTDEEDFADEDDVDSDVNADTNAPVPQNPIPQATETGVVPVPGAKKGCKSSVATTAVVLGIVATFGTAFVIKKKD